MIVETIKVQTLRTEFYLPLLLALTLQCHSLSGALAFMSFPPGSNVHRQILDEGLQDQALSKDSLSAMARGMDSQDNPLSKNWSLADHHACDNKIVPAFNYIDERTARAVELAGDADKSRSACRRSLFTLGEAMHTLQDFYSHANYVEWLLKENKPLLPIDRTVPGGVPAAVRTCYYYFGSSLQQEPFLSHAQNVLRLRAANTNADGTCSLQFRSEAEWQDRQKRSSLSTALDYALKPGQLLHMELNKDSASQLQGRVVSNEDGKTLFQLARSLAVADTLKQWQVFETAIRARYGSRSDAILKALKKG